VAGSSEARPVPRARLDCFPSPAGKLKKFGCGIGLAARNTSRHESTLAPALAVVDAADSGATDAGAVLDEQQMLVEALVTVQNVLDPRWSCLVQRCGAGPILAYGSGAGLCRSVGAARN
jgi:hypothetical protein